MAVPFLSTYQNGVNQVSGDQLNTFLQTAVTVAQLRTFTGINSMVVSLQGFTSPSDGGQGFFYYDSSATAADDGGINYVVPNGATVGAWVRLGASGTSSFVNSITSANGTLTFNVPTGTVTADINLANANTWTGAQTIPLASASTAVTQAIADASTKLATTAFVGNYIAGTALTLFNGTTATTQSPGDSSTKIATTAFVTATASGGQLQHQLFTASGTFTTPSNSTTSTIYKVTCVGTGANTNIGLFLGAGNPSDVSFGSYCIAKSGTYSSTSSYPPGLASASTGDIKWNGGVGSNTSPYPVGASAYGGGITTNYGAGGLANGEASGGGGATSIKYVTGLAANTGVTVTITQGATGSGGSSSYLGVLGICLVEWVG